MRAIAAALLLVWVIGCSSSQEPEPYDLNVYYAQPPCAAPKSESSLGKISSVSILISAPSTDPDKKGQMEEVESTSKSLDGNSVLIERAPVVDDGEIVVTGSEGNTTWYGKTTGLEINKGRTTEIQLRLTRMGKLSCVSPPAEFTGRVFSGVAVMSDGRVFISGGLDSTNGGSLTASKTAFIFNPFTGSVTKVADMNKARAMHGVIGLKDGRVLIVGGVSRATFDTTGNAFPWSTSAVDRHKSLEIYDPKTDQYSERNFLNVDSFVLPAIAKMADGSILVAGGGLSMKTATKNALTFNPDLGGDIQQEGKLLDFAWFGATLVPFGTNEGGLTRVLLVGGNDGGLFARVYQAQSDKNFGLLETVEVSGGSLRAFAGVAGLSGKRFVIAGGFKIENSVLGGPVGTGQLLTVTDPEDFLNITGTLAGVGNLKDAAGFVHGFSPQGTNAVFIGGMTSFTGTVSGQIMEFSGANNTLSEAPGLTGNDAFVARLGQSTAKMLDDTIVVVGGMDGAQQLLDGIETFTPQFLAK